MNWFSVFLLSSFSSHQIHAAYQDLDRATSTYPKSNMIEPRSPPRITRSFLQTRSPGSPKAKPSSSTPQQQQQQRRVVSLKRQRSKDSNQLEPGSSADSRHDSQQLPPQRHPLSSGNSQSQPTILTQGDRLRSQGSASSPPIAPARTGSYTTFSQPAARMTRQRTSTESTMGSDHPLVNIGPDGGGTSQVQPENAAIRAVDWMRRHPTQTGLACMGMVGCVAAGAGGALLAGGHPTEKNQFIGSMLAGGGAVLGGVGAIGSLGTYIGRNRAAATAPTARGRISPPDSAV